MNGETKVKPPLNLNQIKRRRKKQSFSYIFYTQLHIRQPRVNAFFFYFYPIVVLLILLSYLNDNFHELFFSFIDHHFVVNLKFFLKKTLI